jgi:outer membrane protein OmpA-like peptidoglycan-associated protein
MNSTNRSIHAGKSLVAAAVAATLLAACASAPTKSTGAAEVRNRLTVLQADPDLASRAPVAMKEADMAVRAAEAPQNDKTLVAHRVFLADRKVESARAMAETSLVEDQRTALSEQRERARLDARTREADAARRQALVAEAAGAEQKLAAERARSDAIVAQTAADGAQRQNEALQRQLQDMQAEVTERGIVLTLGDVLFTSGRADLRSGTTENLDKLVAFLGQYPERIVAIEGHTDSIGSENSNQALSERRADSVKTYLSARGIGPGRLTAMGKGESTPVADNASDTGRQQNRRVEVIISNSSPVAAR